MLAHPIFCLIASVPLIVASPVSDSLFDTSRYSPQNLIQTKFAILGGGAAGTYAAIALKDQNQTFTLVEIADRLGGNTITYEDPSTGAVIDYGVQLHLNCSVVRNFFSRLNTSLGPFVPSDFGRPQYYDFAKQVALPNYVKGNAGADYVAQLSKYPYLNDLNDLPAQVPSELLLPFPEFAQKAGLSQDSIEGGLTWPATPGDPLNTTALAIYNDGNYVELAEFQGAAIRAANHDNSQIYRNALAEIQSSVLLRSSVIGVQRRPSGVQLVVRTPTGNKLILAKQLIVAFPYTANRTRFWDLDSKERPVLSKISGKYFYGGIVNNTNLAGGIGYTNAGANTSYHAASLPGIVEIAPTAAPGYLFYWYNSVSPSTQQEVQHAARSTIRFLQRQTSVSVSEPTFVAFKDFAPFHLGPPVEDIASGWYSKMKGLQGYRNTWYISAMFVVGSTQVWNNTANILPSIVKAAG